MSTVPATQHLIAFDQPRAGALHVPLRGLGRGPHVESWEAEEGLLFGSASVADAGTLETAARDLYARVIEDVRNARHPYFVRMWNYLGSINELDRAGGADRERYQLFCAGRHDAFVAAGYHHDVDLPAASAVGMRGRGLVTYYLAAREPGVQVENPRQVAAYHYPRQYGPKSPSFSRATVWKDRVYVSGTSSVIGHETVHRGDVLAQLQETLHNIETVLAQTGRTMANVISAKTYLRRASDYDQVSQQLGNLLPSNLYLEADICRADLLLEIECVAR